jgi:SpoVK/Ycf46/Vps4 family AAA+-type ATPase
MAEAQELTTAMSWEDLVLDAEVRRQVDEIASWTEHGMALFIGELGLLRNTAALIAKQKGCPAHRADLGTLVTKQADETKKNLDSLFETAAKGHWLLVLDGIEHAFMQRGAGSAPQRAYLLQRIQEYPGTVIIVTNMRALGDEAFARRFQAVVQFRNPG